jgi:hypothetical protein
MRARAVYPSFAGILAAGGIGAYPWQTGRYYFTPNAAGVGTSNTLGNGTLRLVPFWVPNAVTLDQLGAEITAAGAAGSVLRLGIYADDGTGRPGALELDAGTIAGDAIAVATVDVDHALPAGVHWIGGAVQTGGAQPTVRCLTNTMGIVPNVDAAALPTAGATSFGFQMAGVAGALPSTFVPAASGVGSAPRMFVRVG